MGETEQETPEQEPQEPVSELEPENPDAEPDDEPDEPDESPEEPAEPSVPSSQTVLAARDKALEAETRRHENALRKAYGDDFDTLAPCPLCLTDGWVIPAPPGAMPAEQWEAIQQAAGQLSEENFKQAEYAETCDTCDGYGQVLSGSKTEAGRLIVCRTCEGKGWKAKLEAAPSLPTFTLPPPNTTASPTTYNVNGTPDQWGRPAGHPHYGIEPAYVAG